TTTVPRPPSQRGARHSAIAASKSTSTKIAVAPANSSQAMRAISAASGPAGARADWGPSSTSMRELRQRAPANEAPARSATIAERRADAAKDSADAAIPTSTHAFDPTQDARGRRRRRARPRVGARRGGAGRHRHGDAVAGGGLRASRTRRGALGARDLRPHLQRVPRDRRRRAPRHGDATAWKPLIEEG